MEYIAMIILGVAGAYFLIKLAVRNGVKEAILELEAEKNNGQK